MAQRPPHDSRHAGLKTPISSNVIDFGVDTYECWLLSMGDRERRRVELIKGVPLLQNNGTFFYRFRATKAPETINDKPKVVADFLDMISWFGNRNRKYVMDRHILMSADMPKSTPNGKGGIMLFIKPPGTCGIRLHRKEDEASLYREEVCFIEERYKDQELTREELKRGVPREFIYPGHNGQGMMNRGIRVAYPLYLTEEDRTKKRPHDMCVLIQAGAKLEIIAQYRKEIDIPNWFEISVDDNKKPSLLSIRDPQAPWMKAAQVRLEQSLLEDEEDEARAKIEEQKQIENDLKGL